MGSSAMSPVAVEGRGLHTGAPARVVLHLRPGADVTLETPSAAVRIGELVLVSTARATTVSLREGGPRVGTVEHLFAALGARSIYRDVAIAIEGPELPILDGGATAWCDALATLGVRAGPRPLRVTRHAVLRTGDSTYEFSPSDDVAIEVHVDFDDARIAHEARWTGSAGDFRDRIAPARTFALERDVDELAQRGLARHVDPAAVVVITPSAILSSGLPFGSDEPARHKLLDLVGDFYLHGGPAYGTLRAARPGHAANACAFAWARAEGVLGPA